MSTISQENNSPKITEMTVEPSPQWMRDAGKEIQEKYNLDYVDKAYITGIIARHYRINNSKKIKTMAIISQETWDNMPIEERNNLIEYYKDGLSYPNDLKQSIDTIEFIFGKENLQPKPKRPKTWEDIKEQSK